MVGTSVQRFAASMLVGAVLMISSMVRAQEYTPPTYAPPDDIKQWLNATTSQDPVPPGTVITNSNWQQYQKEMSYGLQTLFSGKYFWKIPSDAQIQVGPTVVLSVPKTYLEATERYGAQTSIGVTPQGHRYVKNYQGGMPFPDAFSSKNDPDKGYKILADDYLSWVPDLICAAVRPSGDKLRAGSLRQYQLHDAGVDLYAGGMEHRSRRSAELSACGRRLVHAMVHRRDARSNRVTRPI